MLKFSKFLFSLIFCFAIYLSQAQDSQGFFLDKPVKGTFSVPLHTEMKPVKKKPAVKVEIDKTDTLAKVSSFVYGQNANIYMTPIIDQPNLMEYLKLLSPTVIRYPGGNISNLFFWNADKGELPADIPQNTFVMPDWSVKEKYWYGKTQGDTSMNVDAYYSLIDSLDAEGIICVNFAYSRYGLSEDPVAAAAHLAAEWVRYDKGRTRYWEIGNENYGAWQTGYRIDTTLNRDGQPEIISGELYGKHFLVFADSMRKAAAEIGAEIKLGAVMVEADNPWANPVDKAWNEGFFRIARNSADFLIVHSYYTPYEQNSDAKTILESAAHESERMVKFMEETCRKYQVEMKPVALTEWNIFAIGSKQSCSIINGMHSTLVLGELIKNKYGLAARWNLANGYSNGDDHGMFNQGDEPGVPKWNPRPVFFYMYYFQQVFGSYMVNQRVTGNSDIAVYSSVHSDGRLGIVLVNKGEKKQTVQIQVAGAGTDKDFYYWSLTGGTDNGEFSEQVFVNDVQPDYSTGGPIGKLPAIPAFSGKLVDGSLILDSPARSVQFILVNK